MHPTAADGGLRGHVPARPECITPHIRFLFIAPQLWIGLPSDPASRQRPCPSPCLRLCITWPSDFHRRSNAPCPAHTFEFTGLRGFSRRSLRMMGWASVERNRKPPLCTDKATWKGRLHGRFQGGATAASSNRRSQRRQPTTRTTASNRTRAAEQTDAAGPTERQRTNDAARRRSQRAARNQSGTRRHGNRPTTTRQNHRSKPRTASASRKRTGAGCN